ncbi:MAG: IS4 family transposase [Methyloglobulus sp.]|nr:IS4 family transposase [Methyloglobulus sp.]
MESSKLQINELVTILNQHFAWNKARMDCFVGMLIGLLKTRNINLVEMATGFASEALPGSRYRRIQRFIHSYWLDYDKVAEFVMSLFGFKDTPFYLAMDRTNWQWGKKNLNILMLAVVYKGVAVPVYWLLLDKKGNSDTRERIALMKRFVRQFGKELLLGVLADREFIGGRWLAWLKEESIPFYLRIKKDAKVPNRRGKPVQAKQLFQFLKPGEALVLPDAKTMTGEAVYLAGLRLADGELLVVASDKACPGAIAIYGKRWQIETLFACLKGRGFNLEETRVTDRTRIKRLLVVPVMAFCWSHRTGEWRHEAVKPIKVKKHQRLANSFFKYGLDWLRDHLLGTMAKLSLVCQTFIHIIENKEIIFQL